MIGESKKDSFWSQCVNRFGAERIRGIRTIRTIRVRQLQLLLLSQQGSAFSAVLSVRAVAVAACTVLCVSVAARKDVPTMSDETVGSNGLCQGRGPEIASSRR